MLCSPGEESRVVCRETMLPAKEEGQARVRETSQGTVSISTVQLSAQTVFFPSTLC